MKYLLICLTVLAMLGSTLDCPAQEEEKLPQGSAPGYLDSSGGEQPNTEDYYPGSPGTDPNREVDVPGHPNPPGEDQDEPGGTFLLPPNTDENGEGSGPGYLDLSGVENPEAVAEEEPPSPGADPAGQAELSLINRQCSAVEYGNQPPFPTAVIKTNGWHFIRSRAPWLPPSPGEAGKTTIAGIDADNDCVRDDIEYFIATLLPAAEQRQARKYLFDYAKWRGQFLMNNLTEQDAKELANLLYTASECTRRALGDTAKTTGKLEKIFAKFHNTFPRSYKYLENNKLLGGWSTREELTISCQ